MNAERISDALNDLDDDLIRQTDEVRQGKRVLYRPPMGGIWAAAACAVLILTGAWMLPKTTDDSAAENGAVMEQNFSTGLPGSTDRNLQATGAGWEEAGYYDLTLTVPPDWEHGIFDLLDEPGSILSLSHGEKKLTVRLYADGFAVCGTGLAQEEIQLNGMTVWVGTYDGKTMWDFVVFPGEYVVENQSGEDWTEEERTAIIQILNTVKIKEDAS